MVTRVHFYKEQELGLSLTSKPTTTPQLGKKITTTVHSSRGGASSATHKSLNNTHLSLKVYPKFPPRKEDDHHSAFQLGCYNLKRASYKHKRFYVAL